MTKVALYARYSSDNQSVASIEDQFRICREQAAHGAALINNELYIGKLVWNRLRYIKDPATGRRVSRHNPRDKWIITEVPELRIVDDELWDAAKTRQGELAEKHANVIAATRAAHTNRFNGTHRPRSLLSGLLVCVCCGGPYALRGQDRYASSNHVMNGSCSNRRSITRAAHGARDRRRGHARLRGRDQPPEPRASLIQRFRPAPTGQDHTIHQGNRRAR